MISVAVIAILTDQALSRQKQDILDQKMVTASALASRFELRLYSSTSILKYVASSGIFSQVNNAEMVSSEFNGIPIGLEDEKRKVLRDTHANYGIFDTIHFMLPNGDIYILEPYERQLVLPRLNFADREYFQGAMATGQPYISNTIISTASNQRVLPIAVPAYSSDSRLTGLVVGATDLVLLETQLRKEIHLANNHRIMYIDENSNVIEDITEASADPFTNLVPMGHLESVQNVLEGKSGYTVEVVDNIEMLTVYEPVAVHEHRWGVLIMQPTADAFSAIDYLRNQSYAMLVIIVSIMGASGYFLVSFRAHSALAKELAKANSVLIEKDKLKDEFLRIASHELKTPIQPILGYSSLAARGKIDQNVAWKVVHTEAQRLMRLANNIVDISMIQAGILGYQMEKVAVAQVIELALDSIREAAKAKNLTLDLKLDEECQKVAIDADPSRLRRVFDELLENAVKFTEKGGIRVECRVEPATDEILIMIRDTGTAIPAAILPRLFDIFVSKSASDPATQGAGLGLFLCQGVVKAHKGTIVAQNNSEGLGACFEVRLPIHSVQERESRTKTAIT